MRAPKVSDLLSGDSRALYCPICDSKYSANKDDYFNLPEDHEFHCCGEQMCLGLFRTVFEPTDLGE